MMLDARYSERGKLLSLCYWSFGLMEEGDGNGRRKLAYKEIVKYTLANSVILDRELWRISHSSSHNFRNMRNLTSMQSAVKEVNK